jgi:hypothetical protein
MPKQSFSRIRRLGKACNVLLRILGHPLPKAAS